MELTGMCRTSNSHFLAHSPTMTFIDSPQKNHFLNKLNYFCQENKISVLNLQLCYKMENAFVCNLYFYFCSIFRKEGVNSSPVHKRRVWQKNIRYRWCKAGALTTQPQVDPGLGHKAFKWVVMLEKYNRNGTGPCPESYFMCHRGKHCSTDTVLLSFCLQSEGEGADSYSCSVSVSDTGWYRVTA